ncbi:hypothetical protein B0I33_103194 [Prauserella shujinwangii]|uniref:Concanavalin A-like lectin/glucanase superfamily protein n=1 Tax=Prauserella shujinwangii TaxID=1453103 RepID=A0A2T0LYG6_9PSEU|nr:hypothetical protein [Prauserella shujinwangii]PRX49161.1 hypothetical protein B0I33_103194 [Prauserella shujinwangii]
MNRKLPTALAACALSLAGVAPAAAGTPGDLDPHEGPFAVVHPQATDRHWEPLNPEKWAFEHGQVVMTERGTNPGGPRRPFEFAIVEKGPELRSLSYRAEVRIDEPVTRNDRDVILVFNYQSPTRFYYAHLSQDNTIYPHNGIFKVADADRVRIDDQWNGTIGAPPAIDDTEWHDVRLDYHAETGRIAVYVDGADEPLMTATDTTFAGGRVGFGSFDNFGRIRDVVVAGSKAVPGQQHTP